MGVIEIYEPKIYFRTQEICAINIRELWWAVSPGGQITPGQEYDQKLPELYGQRLEDGSCTYHYSAPGNPAMSHLHGFIGDFYEIITQFSNNQNSVYAKLNEHNLYAELGSTYADFPPEIGELLFPEFYHYMRDFFDHELATQSNSLKQTI